MTGERPVASVLWLTAALHLFVLLVAVALFGADEGAVQPFLLPVASLVLTGTVGVACLLRRDRRRLGQGLVGGTAVAVAVFLVLFVIFFVTYFVAPGGHELS